MCLLGAFSRQFLEIVPEAEYVCLFFFLIIASSSNLIYVWVVRWGWGQEENCLRQWSEWNGFQLPQAKVGKRKRSCSLPPSVPIFFLSPTIRISSHQMTSLRFLSFTMLNNNDNT